MNMQAAIQTPGDGLPWTRLDSEVSQWRGACLQAFAQAEAAVTETLLLLSGAGERGRGVQLRHLLGQRLEDLAKAIGPDGGFAAEGVAASEALAAFRRHEVLRGHLAHDVARVAVERNGEWVVILRHLLIRGRTAERGSVAFEQSEALRLLAELRRMARHLDATLGTLRRVVEGQIAGGGQ